MDKTHAELVSGVHELFKEATTEVSQRNEYITKRDNFIYGEGIRQSLDIPYGHDFTGINWLRRTIEIHSTQFMGRGFQPISSYETEDPEKGADEEDNERINMENQARKARSEMRSNLMKAMIKDNGGSAFFQKLAEDAGAVGFSVVKSYYDEKEKKIVFSEVETVENFYTIWSDSDFRKADAYAYVWQISPQAAMRDYGLAKEDLAYSKNGAPFSVVDQATTPDTAQSTRNMITAMEVTGYVPGWTIKKNKLVKTAKGKETKINLLIVGKKICRAVGDEKKIPEYYILPNKEQRRRPWGLSDVTDAAIDINLSYIETVSDWRTVASRVNFPKFKAYNFGMDVQIPTPRPRKVEILPLDEGQDIQYLNQGDSNQVDFRAQAEELRDQFAQEVALSRVFFNDPSLTFNSNQALLTSMKPTTDVAERKKVLWGPILAQMFLDALTKVVLWNPELKELIDDDENWNVSIKWPSATPKEDPVYQTNLLNRLNANAISYTTFFEEMGEGKEEMDRIKQDLQDPITAALTAKQIAMWVNQKYFAGDGKPQPKVNVNLRGDLTPHQEGNLADQMGFQDGPFPATIGPQGQQGLIAQENQDNEGFLDGNPFQGGTPKTFGADGQEVPSVAEDSRPMQTPQSNNQPGEQLMSQPGSGAPAVSPEGAVATEAQNRGA